MTDKVTRVSVKSVNQIEGITVKHDASLYYSKLSEGWAHGDGIIEGIDYSSKYYAQQSKIFSQTSGESATNAKAILDSATQVITEAKEAAIAGALATIDSANAVALQEVEAKRIEAVENIESTTIAGETSLTDLHEQYANNMDAILSRTEEVADEAKDTVADRANRSLDNLDETGIAKFNAKVDIASMVPIGFSEVPCIVETYQNGSSWYYVRSDGWCEQGGRVTRSTNDMTISLLKTMTNTDYSILRSEIGAVKNQYDSVIHNITTTSLKVYCGMTTSEKTEIIWEAKGYIA